MYFGNRWMRFMWGRYGMDRFSRFLVIFALVLAFINCFFRTWILQIVVYAVLGYVLFRFLSKNERARLAENRAYTKQADKIKAKFNILRERQADKTHIYRKCPGCKAVLRLPRRKGKHRTVCPKCSKSFTVRVFRDPKNIY